MTQANALGTRRLGTVTLDVPDDFDAPLDEREVAAWEGRTSVAPPTPR